MKPIAVLIKCTVYDPVSASDKIVRVTNRNDPRVTTWGGFEWRPILIRSPSVGLSVFNGDFSGFGQTTIDNFIMAATEKDLDAIASYTWHGATIEIYAGDPSATPFSPTLIFTAVGNGLSRKSNESLTVDLQTNDRLTDKQLLYLSYAGTGDIEGTVDLTGIVKPMVFGDAKYCKPVLIDEVRQIYQVHGYGPVESIYGAFEGGLVIGGSAAPATSTKWRLLIDSTGNTTDSVSMGEIEMRPQGGAGADLLTGGTASSDSFYSAGYEANKASDDNNATLWHTALGSGTTHWWQYTFASAVSIGDVRIRARGDAENNTAPRNFKLQRWDGSTWVDVLVVSSEPLWATGEQRTFIVPAAGQPYKSFSLAAGDTYAKFRDAGVAQGQWLRFNDLGLIKLGSQPTFPITVHVKGDTNGVAGGTALTKAADIVKRMVTMTVSGVAISNSSITSLNTAAPQPIDLYFEDQVAVLDAVAITLRSIGGYWFWDSTGQMRFGRMRFGSSSFTLSAKADQLPDVMNVSQLATSSPVWSLRFGAQACHFVHDASSVPAILAEMQSDAELSGFIFPPSSTPPTGAVDGDTWPDTSVSPTVFRRYDSASSSWVAIASYGGDVNALNIFNSASGTPTVPLTQSQLITLLGTAAAITGQGSLATLNSADYATQVGGVSKPEPYTVAGGNLIYNAELAVNTDSWQLTAGATGFVRTVGSAGDPVPAYFRINDASYAYGQANTAPGGTGLIKIDGGKRLFLSAYGRRSGAAATQYIGVEFLNANNSASLGFTWYDLGALITAVNTWFRAQWAITPPAGAAFVRITAHTNTLGNAGNYDTGGIRVSNQAAGADETAIQPLVSGTDGAPNENLVRNASFVILDAITGLPILWSKAASASWRVGGAGEPSRYVRLTVAGEGITANVHVNNTLGAGINPYPGGASRQKLFWSIKARKPTGSTAPYGSLNFELYKLGGFVVGLQAQVLTTALDVFQLIKGTFDVSPYDFDSFRANFYTVGNGDFDVYDIRVANTELLATVGADINTNVVDTFSGSPVTIPRNELKTSLGTAAAITGQAATATSSDFSVVTGGTKPENNATIDANIIAPSPIIIYADSTGTPKTGEINKIVALKLTRLGVDLTSGVTWAATLLTGNATFTMTGAGTGTFTITGPNSSSLALESTVRIDATYAGVARSTVIRILRQDDPPTNTGGGGSNPGTTASTTSLGTATATTYGGTQESPVLRCKAGTAGQVVCTAPIGFQRLVGTNTGHTGAFGKWQWRVVGGSFADITTEQASNQDAITQTHAGDPTDNFPGAITVSMTKTGLTSGTDYEFKFLWRKNNVSGSVDDIYKTGGTLQAAGS